MPSKSLLIRLHRWVALVFALPLVVVIGTGLVLAVEPALKANAPDGAVTPARLEAVIAAADPAGGSGSLFVRAYDGTATVGGRGGSRTFDLATAIPSSLGPLAAVFQTSRRLHETLLLDLGWLVTASTVALVALAPLGLLLGWPGLRNTIGGWHGSPAGFSCRSSWAARSPASPWLSASPSPPRPPHPPARRRRCWTRCA